MPRATTSTSAHRTEPTDPDRRPDSQQPERLIDTGYTPACVVETSPDNFQAWLKHAWSLTAQEGTVAPRSSRNDSAAIPNSADWRHFGRLAGFTNPKPQYRLPNGLFPYSQLKFALSKGVIYPKRMRCSPRSRTGCSINMWSLRGPSRRASASRSIPGRHLNFSTTHISPTNMLRTAERHKADLTYATYSLQRGVPEIEVRDTIRAHASTSAFVNRSQRDKDAYIDRTVRKALKQNGINIPMQPTLQTAELAADCFLPVRGRDALRPSLASTPSGSPLPTPAGWNPRNAPAHSQNNCARTSVTISHGEKKR